MRYKGKTSVFQLTTAGFRQQAHGLWYESPRWIVATGKPTYTRVARVFVQLSAREFDGLRQSEPNPGQPDIGPEHQWRFDFQLGVKKLVTPTTVVTPSTVHSP